MCVCVSIFLFTALGGYAIWACISELQRRPRSPSPSTPTMGGGGKRRRTLELSPEGFNGVEFPLLLAAGANLDHPHARSLAKRLLRDRLLLISRRSNASSPPPADVLLPSSLLSILPLFINTRSLIISLLQRINHSYT